MLDSQWLRPARTGHAGGGSGHGEQPFDVPLIDQETGEVLDRSLVGSLDLLERDADGRLVVVDLKTSERRYTDLQVEASL